MARLRADFVRPPTTQEAVLAELRKAILHGEFPPGTQLVQEEIAQGFNLSRVPIREALRLLEGEGHVVYRPRRGYVVAELDHADLVEITRLQQLLESDAVRRAMARPGTSDRAAMRRHLSEMDAAAATGDVAAYDAADRAFHRCLVEPCGRAWLTKIIDQLWDAAAPYRALVCRNPAPLTTARTDHEAILTALETHDTDRVLALLDQHRNTAVTDAATALANP